jgi:hypothetical protein
MNNVYMKKLRPKPKEYISKLILSVFMLCYLYSIVLFRLFCPSFTHFILNKVITLHRKIY